MKVQIRAVAPQGVEVTELPFGGRRTSDGVHVSGRFFPTGGYREVEILDQDEEPPTVIRSFPNPSNPGQVIKFHAEDPDRMGRKTYQAMIDCGRFTIQETASVDARITGAEVAAAKAEVARLSADLMNANIALATQKTEIGKLQAEIDALKAAAAAPKSKKSSKEDRIAT